MVCYFGHWILTLVTFTAITRLCPTAEKRHRDVTLLEVSEPMQGDQRGRSIIRNAGHDDDNFLLPAPPIMPPPPPSIAGNTDALLRLVVYNNMQDNSESSVKIKGRMKHDTSSEHMAKMKCANILRNISDRHEYMQPIINGKSRTKDNQIYVCEKGEQGIKGEEGARGSKGNKGETGKQGAKCDCKKEFNKLWIERSKLRKLKRKMKNKKKKAEANNDMYNNRVRGRGTKVRGRKGPRGHKGSPGPPGPGLLHFANGYVMQHYNPGDDGASSIEGLLAYRSDVKKLYFRDDIGWRSIKTTVCGDGIIDKDDGEKCDDGNSNNDDSCAGCKYARCGDGFIQRRYEECDGRHFAGRTCSTFRRGMVGRLRCTHSCRISYSKCHYVT